MNRFVCIHGHFYQPPRESPWLEEVELQDSAYPYHDWNERIAAECYAPNTASRIVDGENHILDLLNNYSHISFNIGPTLCAWMERHKPNVLAAIVEADRASQKHFGGHGSAIAQVYNHMIMPLATHRDKYTQAYWGIVDFERRFNRYPEGMWLPETAVDLETLEVLTELRIKFTILASRQAKRVRPLNGNADWQECGAPIDTTVPYLCTLPSGRSIGIFFYDGAISQEMAFGTLLDNGVRFAQRLASAFPDQNTHPQLVSVATDGESYGHHHRHGDMALSYCLHTLQSMEGIRLTNFGEFLSHTEPTHEIEIHENSSWSCVHGVERWRDDCGCNSGRPDWHQKWRRPLREAFDFLRDTLTPRFADEMRLYCSDPWKARNDYSQVVGTRTRPAAEAFIARHALRDLTPDEKSRVLRLCELARHLMLMYTSCGWFFDDISGIEGTQVMQYAARGLQLGQELFGEQLKSSSLRYSARHRAMFLTTVPQCTHALSCLLDWICSGSARIMQSIPSLPITASAANDTVMPSTVNPTKKNSPAISGSRWVSCALNQALPGNPAASVSRFFTSGITMLRAASGSTRARKPSPSCTRKSSRSSIAGI